MLQDDVELVVAAELAGVERSDAAADTLARVGVLEDARPLRFVHAIVGDAVAARLSAGVRDTLHARAANPLLASRAGVRWAEGDHRRALEDAHEAHRRDGSRQQRCRHELERVGADRRSSQNAR